MTTACMIVNPASANGRTAKQWPEIARRARAHGIEAEVLVTDGPGHATELAAAAVARRVPLVVAVGGDGTVSEIANGMIGAPATDLAVVQRGSGCDFGRTFGISKRTDRALAIAAGSNVRRIDAGRVTFVGPDGVTATRHFANIASAGLTGVAADRVNRRGKPLGATVAFAWAAMATFFTYRNSRFAVDVDEERIDQVCNNVIVGNCRYFAGGMRILPMADPSDGLLDVLVWGDVSKVDLARNLHKLYRGTHVTHPKATIRRARRVVVAPLEPLPIEVDGEQPGLTPATFEVVPSALRLRAPGG